MTGRLAQIWRHPIKAHGRERIDQVTLEAGKALPWDRVWAVAHESSCFDPARPSWNPPGDFSRGANSPRLQAITAFTDPAYRSVTLFHPDLPDLTIKSDDHGDACEFIQWVMPISLGTRLLPARLVRAPDEAMTDTGYQSISLINLASHQALADHMGQDLSPLRWRGNFLIEGFEAWAEMDWIGKTLTVGETELEIVEPIGRCRMTEANPETGHRDADTLRGLREGFGHTNCGVYAKVTKGGFIQEGDRIEVLT
ncbi:MAG: MOSC domain-containing protein [Marinibacterium sp.]